MPKFSIRMLAAVVAALAVSLGILRNPTPTVAAGVSAVLAIAMIAAGCWAIGAQQPTRSFCIAFIVASIAALWLSYGATPRRLSFPVPTDAAHWLLRASLVRYWQPSLEPIIANLSALLGGLLGGWMAWAARRRAMRTANPQPPAG